MADKEICSVCKWKAEQDVLTITIMHKVEMREVQSKNGKHRQKPNTNCRTSVLLSIHKHICKITLSKKVQVTADVIVKNTK